MSKHNKALSIGSIVGTVLHPNRSMKKLRITEQAPGLTLLFAVMVVNMCIAVLVNWIAGGQFIMNFGANPQTIMQPFWIVVLSPTWALIANYIGIRIIHVIAGLIGGKGTVGKTLYGVAAATVPALLSTLLISVGMLSGNFWVFMGTSLLTYPVLAWTFLIQYYTFKHNYSFKRLKAIGMVILLMVIGIVLMSPLILAGIASSAPAQAPSSSDSSSSGIWPGENDLSRVTYSIPEGFLELEGAQKEFVVAAMKMGLEEKGAPPETLENLANVDTMKVYAMGDYMMVVMAGGYSPYTSAPELAEFYQDEGFDARLGINKVFIDTEEFGVLELQAIIICEKSVFSMSFVLPASMADKVTFVDLGLASFKCASN